VSTNSPLKSYCSPTPSTQIHGGDPCCRRKKDKIPAFSAQARRTEDRGICIMYCSFFTLKYLQVL